MYECVSRHSWRKGEHIKQDIMDRVNEKGGEEPPIKKATKPRTPPGWNELKAILDDQLEKTYITQNVGVPQSAFLAQNSLVQIETLCYMKMR